MIDHSLNLQKNLTLKTLIDQIENLDSFESDVKPTKAIANLAGVSAWKKKAKGKRDKAKETRKCLVCDRVGHLVKDCRDPRKEAWIKRRRAKERKRDDSKKHEESRGRSRDRNNRERSSSRESSRESRDSNYSRSGKTRSRRPQDRDSQNTNDEDGYSSAGSTRSQGRNNHSKKKNKSSGAWLTSNGDRFDDSDDSDDSAASRLVIYEEWVAGERVEIAFNAVGSEDMVCIDSGTNRLVLIFCLVLKITRLQSPHFFALLKLEIS
jgi:hypothetical protein